MKIRSPDNSLIFQKSDLRKLDEKCKKYISAQKKILNHPTVIMQPFIQKFFIIFLFDQSLLKQLGLNKGIYDEMAERFSQKNLRVRPSSDEEKIVTNAKKHFEKTLVEISGELVGSVAALEHPTKNKKLNYGEIFLRDNVPVMIYLITQKRYEIVKKFLSVCLELQSTNYQTRGVFPTSFVEENGKLIGDYGQRLSLIHI